MSMKMSVDAYKELIEGNMKWLGEQSSSCERSHIMGIVRDSTNYYYPENYKEESDKTIQELKAALLELYSIWCIAEIELEDADYSRVEEIKAIANKG